MTTAIMFAIIGAYFKLPWWYWIAFSCFSIAKFIEFCYNMKDR